jgi:WD40 repeat protein
MYLWDPTNNGTKPVARLLGHQNKVNQVQFSPDGTLIASAGWDNSTVSRHANALQLNQVLTINIETLERQGRQVPQEPEGPRRTGKPPSNG